MSFQSNTVDHNIPGHALSLAAILFSWASLALGIIPPLLAGAASILAITFYILQIRKLKEKE